VGGRDLGAVQAGFHAPPHRLAEVAHDPLDVLDFHRLAAGPVHRFADPAGRHQVRPVLDVPAAAPPHVRELNHQRGAVLVDRIGKVAQVRNDAVVADIQPVPRRARAVDRYRRGAAADRQSDAPACLFHVIPDLPLRRQTRVGIDLRMAGADDPVADHGRCGSSAARTACRTVPCQGFRFRADAHRAGVAAIRMHHRFAGHPAAPPARPADARMRLGSAAARRAERIRAAARSCAPFAITGARGANSLSRSPDALRPPRSPPPARRPYRAGRSSCTTPVQRDLPSLLGSGSGKSANIRRNHGKRRNRAAARRIECTWATRQPSASK